MIEIDGAFGSGGGQILRTAAAFSVITKKPCHILNIRKNRPKPGLAVQHLLGVQALAKLCNGKLEGDFLGSQDLKFYPHTNFGVGVWPGEIGPKELNKAGGVPPDILNDTLNIKIETAGSITLILQTLVLAGLFSTGEIKINFDGGATDTFFSPTIDHLRYVFLKNLEKVGVKVQIDILKRGYYPEGGAKVKVIIFPFPLKNFDAIERGGLKKILAISGAATSLRDKKVAERQMAGVREIIGKLKLPIEEKIEYYDTDCPGSQICLIAEFSNSLLGVDNLGKLGKRAEDVGKEAATELLKEEKSGACLDKHMADQILPYMALAGGKSQVTVSEITEHCQTNMWVIEKFLDGKFEIKGNLISWLPNRLKNF